MNNHADHWLHGLGFAVRVWFALVVAFGLPFILARFVNDAELMPDWFRFGVPQERYHLIVSSMVMPHVADPRLGCPPWESRNTGPTLRQRELWEMAGPTLASRRKRTAGPHVGQRNKRNQ